MTALDDALEKYLTDDNAQGPYYEMILSTDFYIPIIDDDSGTPVAERENLTPLILEAEGKHYVLMFDTEERVNQWSKEPVTYMLLAGYEMAKHTPPNLHWAVNIGCQHAKEFVPEEIAHLKDLSTK